MTSITAQREEVEREVRQRERLYPRWIAERKLREETAETKLATLRAAATSLRFIEAHAVGLRALCHFLLASAPGQTPIPSEDERQALLAHPAVTSLLAVWPEAEVSVLGGPSAAHTAAGQPDEVTVRDLFEASGEREHA